MGLTIFKAFSLFLCLLWSFTCPGRTFVFEENGTVRPNNPVVFIGHNLTLFCNLTSLHVHSNSLSMYFTKQFRNGTHTISRAISQEYVTIINTRTIRLDYPVRSAVNQGTYYCKINRTVDREPLTLGRQYVMVEYELKPVSSIDCRVFNWKTMRCTWELGVNYINMDNIIVTLVWAIHSQEDCPHQTKTSCTWEEDDEDVGKSFKPDVQYVMMINTTLVNQVGSLHKQVKSKQFTIDSRCIVEPARVHKLRVTSQNSTCASLTWHHNQRVYEKYYRLWYRPQWSADAHWEEVSPIKDEHVTVCGLKPATNYTFRVSCYPIPTGEDEPEGFWSGWRTIVNQTAEDIPGKAPKISPGGFTVSPCNDFSGCQNVTLFWQPVEERHRNGHILGYELQLSAREGEDPQVLSINSESTTWATLQLVSEVDYKLSLRSRNSIGYSSSDSSLIIPSRKRKPSAPSDFLVETSSYSKPTRFYLSWSSQLGDSQQDHRVKDLGYTLYWCLGSLQSVTCQNYIDWISFPINQTSYEYLSSGEATGDHLFGISREVMSDNNSTISSGITWNSCTYIKGETPDKPPKNFHVSVYKEDRSLKVEWQPFVCFESRAFVTHYIIHYCEANVAGECTGVIRNITVDKGETYYIIRNLKPDVLYMVTGQAVSRAGPGPESGPLRGQVEDNDLVHNPGALAGIIIGCVSFVILVAFVFIRICRKCVQAKKNFYYRAKYPDSICRSINSLPPLPQGCPLNDPKYHFQDRPLPPRPDAVPFGLGILDDGYSSAGSNRSNDVKYEPIGTKADANNRESRNISVTSETCLLGHMEDNSKSDDKYHHKDNKDKAVTMQNADSSVLASSSCNSFGGKRPLDRLDSSASSYCDKKSKTISKIPENSVADVSVQSYIKFGLNGQSDSSAVDNNNLTNPEQTLCIPNSIHLQQIQNINRVPPQSPVQGFVFSSPPPDTPPPPPPIPYITRAERILAKIEGKVDRGDHRMKSSSKNTQIPKQQNRDEDNDDEFADYSQVAGEAVNPGNFEYLPHPDDFIVSESTASPSSSSTITGQVSSGDSQLAGSGTSVTRPLSEYMKQLPLHYFEEPHFNSDDLSPTTEL